MAKREQSTYERLNNKNLNRKERRELNRRLFSDDPGLEILHPDAAGIDIGNESHFVSVLPERDPEPVREFGSWTMDLERMAVWMKSCGIKTVAMQSTGVYWIAAYDVLEKHGFEVFLVNALDTRNLPGRKTDVQESQWLRKLHTYGLLRNSFRPPDEIRAVRTRLAGASPAGRRCLSPRATHAEGVDHDECTVSQCRQRHHRVTVNLFSMGESPSARILSHPQVVEDDSRLER